MKRIVVEAYGGPHALKLVEQDPPATGPEEILIEVHAAGVNPVDIYCREGSQGYTPALPFCPGFEAAGVITAMGSQAMASSSLQIGDRVYCGFPVSGCYGQWAIAHFDSVFPVPMGLPIEKAAVLYLAYFTAYRALFSRGSCEPGDRALVHGASGGVGIAALQWCRFSDIMCWGTAGSDQGLEAIQTMDAVSAVDRRIANYTETLLDESGGFDCILEMRADLNLEADLGMLRPGGRVIVIGSRGAINITPRKTMGGETDIRGVTLKSSTTQENRVTHSAIEKAVASGDIDPLISTSYTLAQASSAQRDMESLPACGKRVIICT